MPVAASPLVRGLRRVYHGAPAPLRGEVVDPLAAMALGLRELRPRLATMVGLHAAADPRVADRVARGHVADDLRRGWYGWDAPGPSASWEDLLAFAERTGRPERFNPVVYPLRVEGNVRRIPQRYNGDVTLVRRLSGYEHDDNAVARDLVRNTMDRPAFTEWVGPRYNAEPREAAAAWDVLTERRAPKTDDPWWLSREVAKFAGRPAEFVADADANLFMAPPDTRERLVQRYRDQLRAKRVGALSYLNTGSNEEVPPGANPWSYIILPGAERWLGRAAGGAVPGYAGGGPVKTVVKSGLSSLAKMFERTTSPVKEVDPLAYAIAIRQAAELEKAGELLGAKSGALTRLYADPALRSAALRAQAEAAARAAETVPNPGRRKFVKNAAALAARQAIPGQGLTSQMARELWKLSPTPDAALAAVPETAQPPAITIDLLRRLTQAQKDFHDAGLLDDYDYPTYGAPNDPYQYSEMMYARSLKNQLERWLRKAEKTGQVPDEFKAALTAPGDDARHLWVNYDCDGMCPELLELDVPGVHDPEAWVPHAQRPYGVTSPQADAAARLKRELENPDRAQQPIVDQEFYEQILPLAEKMFPDSDLRTKFDTRVKMFKRKK